ncbi:MAG: sensor domain-containing diguanylate cyclase [Gammaproteobacteria bacterium]|nr:sensor domain-containing diguanylate cyclase [Gammaproteobacteria bacterium]
MKPYEFPLKDDGSQRRLLGLYGLLVLFGVLFFIVSLSFFVWQNLNQSKSDFHQFGTRISETLQQAFVVNETILDGFAAFLADVGVQEPYRARFYSKTMMERYSNLYMFQAAQRIEGSDVASFEKQLSYKMDSDIHVRRFEFGQGFVNVAHTSDAFYYPLVFVEPESNNSFNMLGLDISSIQFVNDAMEQSLVTGLASISEGFELIDGNTAFVMIKPSLLPGQDLPDQYALLVIKSQALLQDIVLDKPGMQLNIRYGELAPLADVGTSSKALWEQALFPMVQFEKEFPLGHDTVKLTLTQQLGVDSINLTLLILIALVFIAAGIFMHLFLRKHYQGELEKLHANHKLYQRANYDRLTGLANRHYFEDYLMRSIAGCQRRADKIGLLYVDLNDFKEINDTHGHDTGDRVLIMASAILLDCIRMDDVACRFGGDEFVVLLEHVITTEDAKKVMWRIHDEMSKVQFVDKKTITLSASIGLAMYPEDGRTLEELLKTADHKMYAAKRQGKVLSMEQHKKH